MTPDLSKEGQTVIAHGRGSKHLAEGIGRYLNLPIIDHTIGQYKDGETHVSINENIRGKNVIFVGSTPDMQTDLKPNDVVMEYAFVGDALRRSKARSFDFLVPYIPFDQQSLSQNRLVTNTILQSDPRTAHLIDPSQNYATELPISSPHKPWLQYLHASSMQRLFKHPSSVDMHTVADDQDMNAFIPDLIDDMPIGNHTVIMHGRGAKELATGISHYLNIPIAAHTIRESQQGETKISIDENIRGKNVIFIGSSPDLQKGIKPNDVVMEYAYIGNALQDAGASAFRFLVRYMPYARQDRTKGERVALTSKRVIDTLMQVQPSNVMLVEPHTEYLEQAFPSNNPPDILWFTNLFATNIAKLVTDLGIDEKRVVPVAADHGTKTRVMQLTKTLREIHQIKAHPNLVIADKNRINPESIELMSFTGGDALLNALALLPDDILASGTTMIESAKAAKGAGATAVICMASHATLTPGNDKIPQILKELDKPDSMIDLLVLTDTMPIPDSVRNHPRVLILSAAECMALASHNAWGVPYPGVDTSHAGSLRGFNRGLCEPLTPQTMPHAQQRNLLKLSA